MRKFSERINESMMDKDPIDPSEDVKEYRAMFPDNNPYVVANLKNIEMSHPTMTDKYNIYGFYVNDIRSNIVGEDNFFGEYIKAISSEHALIRMAIRYTNKDFRVNFVTNSGYLFDKEKDKNILLTAKEIDVDSLVEKYEKELERLRNPI